MFVLKKRLILCVNCCSTLRQGTLTTASTLQQPPSSTRCRWSLSNRQTQPHLMNISPIRINQPSKHSGGKVGFLASRPQRFDSYSDNWSVIHSLSVSLFDSPLGLRRFPVLKTEGLSSESARAAVQKSPCNQIQQLCIWSGLLGVWYVKAVVLIFSRFIWGREKKPHIYWLDHFVADGRLDTTERCTFSFQRRRFFLLTLTHKSCFFEPLDSHAQESLTQGIAFLPGELRIVIFRLFGADSLFIRKMSLASLLLGTWIHFQLLPRKSSHLFQPPSRQHTRLCIEKNRVTQKS